jgi:hypothetical protein
MNHPLVWSGPCSECEEPMSCSGLTAQQIKRGDVRPFCVPCQIDMMDVTPKTQTLDCNHHSDCNKADEEAKAAGKKRPFHCRIDDCEDCFGC